MSEQSTLTQAFTTYGDELYQAALLLAPSPRRAEALLLRAARSLAAAPPAQLDLPEALAALLAALPEAEASAAPGGPWAGQAAPALAALAQLPAAQRLALDMALRYDYQPAQVAALFAGDRQRAEQALASALLAIAPAALPDLPEPLRQLDAAPETCQLVRRTLAARTDTSFNAHIRGHLASCASCRAAEQAIGQVRALAEQAMRRAMRGTHMPARLAEQIQAIIVPAPRATRAAQLLRQPIVMQGLLLLAVLGLMAALILPRPQQQAMGSTSITPRQLIAQARATLYAAPEGQPMWHSRYEMRWDFSDKLYANLVGDLWLDQGEQRYRAQLTHAAGGAPYELLLARGEDTWYSATPTYGQSIYGLLYPADTPNIQFKLPEAQRSPFLQARLADGAWGLAQRYLDLGLQAESLRSWGRQRGADGSEQIIIGFEAACPTSLSMPQEHPPTVTILLSIDEASGRLREIRELTPQGDGQLASRTMWRLTAEEPIPEEQTATLFSIQLAYNGTGSFARAENISDLYVPTIPFLIDWVKMRAQMQVREDDQRGWMLPASPPAGIDRAIMVEQVDGKRAAIYLGPQKRLVIYSPTFSPGRTIAWLAAALSSQYDPATPMLPGIPAPSDDDTAMIFSGLSSQPMEFRHSDSALIAIKPGLHQHYGTQVVWNTGQRSQQHITIMESFGFSYEELQQVVDSLAPFNQQTYRGTADLFTTP